MPGRGGGKAFQVQSAGVWSGVGVRLGLAAEAVGTVARCEGGTGPSGTVKGLLGGGPGHALLPTGELPCQGC